MNKKSKRVQEKCGFRYHHTLENVPCALPGVHIGDGAIIGANSVVGGDVLPYTIVVGNPAKVLRKRFDDELIDLMLRLKWWDKSIKEIDSLIPILTCSDLEKVRRELKARVGYNR